MKEIKLELDGENYSFELYETDCDEFIENTGRFRKFVSSEGNFECKIFKGNKIKKGAICGTFSEIISEDATKIYTRGLDLNFNYLGIKQIHFGEYVDEEGKKQYSTIRRNKQLIRQ